jgi:hypothetical protein
MKLLHFVTAKLALYTFVGPSIRAPDTHNLQHYPSMRLVGICIATNSAPKVDDSTTV